MFNDSWFYHARIKKSVALFGKIFNNVHIIRKASNGNVISSLTVPLSYGPKRKYLERIRENPDLETDTKVAINLPRMSFEITSINYDSSRQTQKMNRQAEFFSDNEKTYLRSGVPYIINFQLSIYSKTQDDGLQVVEQILPKFAPQYTLTMIPIADFPNMKEDVPVTLQSVSLADDFEGSLDQRRTIIYTLDFEMKIMFYDEIQRGKIIRKAINDIYVFNSSGAYDKLETLTIDPDPINVNPDSDYGFTETITSYDSSG